jgi:hypothetical protein
LLRATGGGQAGAYRRLYCSAGIARLAAEALLAGRTQEATFLARQSENAYTGATAEVACPSAGANVPEIGAVRCTVRENGRDVEVPCDEEPLRGFYPELLEATNVEIERLASVRERFPNLPQARIEATAAVRDRSVAFERARAEEARTPPVPATTPQTVDRSVRLDGGRSPARTRPCATRRCEEARLALDDARRREAEVDAAIKDEREAIAALRRNATILQEIETNPSNVSNMVSRTRTPRGTPR